MKSNCSSSMARNATRIPAKKHKSTMNKGKSRKNRQRTSRRKQTPSRDVLAAATVVLQLSSSDESSLSSSVEKGEIDDTCSFLPVDTESGNKKQNTHLPVREEEILSDQDASFLLLHLMKKQQAAAASTDSYSYSLNRQNDDENSKKNRLKTLRRRRRQQQQPQPQQHQRRRNPPGQRMNVKGLQARCEELDSQAHELEMENQRLRARQAELLQMQETRNDQTVQMMFSNSSSSSNNNNNNNNNNDRRDSNLTSQPLLLQELINTSPIGSTVLDLQQRKQEEAQRQSTESMSMSQSSTVSSSTFPDIDALRAMAAAKSTVLAYAYPHNPRPVDHVQRLHPSSAAAMAQQTAPWCMASPWEQDPRRMVPPPLEREPQNYHYYYQQQYQHQYQHQHGVVGRGGLYVDSTTSSPSLNLLLGMLTSGSNSVY